MGTVYCLWDHDVNFVGTTNPLTLSENQAGFLQVCQRGFDGHFAFFTVLGQSSNGIVDVGTLPVYKAPADGELCPAVQAGVDQPGGSAQGKLTEKQRIGKISGFVLRTCYHLHEITSFGMLLLL